MNYQNPDKLRRATEWARLNGKAGDQAAIKARYIELGGLITGDEPEVEVEEEGEPVKAKKGKKIEE